MKPKQIDFMPGCDEFAKDRQLIYLEAIRRLGNIFAAAKEIGCHHSSIQESMDRLAKKASLKDRTLHLGDKVAPGFAIKGTSTYFDKDGKPSAQWVKTNRDEEASVQLMRDAIEDAMKGLPRVEPTPAPNFTHASLCNLFTLTDSHVGSLCWKEEGGADWDLRIAERTLTGCFQHMVNSSPAAGTCIVNQLGDWMHADSILPVTPTSNHILDADGRFSKVVQVAIRILRRVIDMALEQHEKVVVLLAEGNHDISSSIWLRAMFQALYENEPRIHVIDSALPYYVYQHGNTMLCFHHGHLKKNDQLPILFAAQFPKLWGATTKRYAHTGHRHHVEEKEHSGITVMQHATLTARDAYAARGGWLSERQVTSFTYHDVYGQVARNTVTPEMIGE